MCSFYKIIVSGMFIYLSICTYAQNWNPETTSLKEAFKGKFYIGTALSHYQISGNNKSVLSLVISQFNSITAENVMKWEKIHPSPDKYNFGPADEFVNFGIENNMFIIGHTLVWHSQAPDWIFETDSGKPAGRELLIERMKDHINNVMSRYKGKINGWDVVNEAFEDDGKMRESKWKKIIGEDYIEIAFKTASAIDPDAELYYNDYNLWKPEKRKAAIDVIKNMQSKGIRIDGVGLQGHWSLTTPAAGAIDSAIQDFGKLGLKVMVTELDINVLPNPWDYTGADVNTRFELKGDINRYTQGLPDSVSIQQANRYSDLFKVFLKHRETVERITFWGVDDGHSWKNNWPVMGRTDYPLLFDRNFKPKACYFSIVELADK